MIAMIAALALQDVPPIRIPPAPPPVPIEAPRPRAADVPEAVNRQLHRCLSGRLGPQGHTAEPAATGEVVHLEISRATCRIWLDGWRSKNDAVARAVRDELADWTPAWRTVVWRQRMASGMRMSTFEQREADGDFLGFVRLHEPPESTKGMLEITFDVI